MGGTGLAASGSGVSSARGRGDSGVFLNGGGEVGAGAARRGSSGVPHIPQ